MERRKGSGGMGRGISGVKRCVVREAAVAGIVILLVFAAGCSGDLLGYIKVLVAQGECGGIIQLPKTGQTTCYDGAGNVIPESGTGQDGELKMGIACPVPRFTVGTGTESGCIIDNLTGPMWEQSPSPTERTWTDALTYADDLSLGGHSDWRLPNANELESLANAVETPWLNSQNFDGGLYYYWSSTTWAPDPSSAWVVYLDGGYMVHVAKTVGYYELDVRSGQ